MHEPKPQNRPIWDYTSLQQQPNTANKVVNNPRYTLCNSIETGQTVVLGQLSSVQHTDSSHIRSLMRAMGVHPIDVATVIVEPQCNLLSLK